MPRGGKRPRSGRPPGSKTRLILALTPSEPTDDAKPSPRMRMATMRRQVALAVAAGFSKEKIAVLMGFDVGKLEAVFPRELAHGAEIVLLDRMLDLDMAAGEGKVAAAKAMLEKIADSAPQPAKHAPEQNSGGTKLQRAALLLLQGGQSKKET